MGKIDEVAGLLTRLAGDAPPPAIRAYHGSPYDFDKFDASKIGTGEGAQAYGHGLYFAGNEGVARSYRDSLKDLVDLPVPDELDGQLMRVISEIGQLSGQRGKVVGSEWDAIQAQLDQKQNLLLDLQHRYREAAQNPGHMYEVEIGHPEESLLDWDAPMSRQPMAVQRAYGDMAMEMPGDGRRVYTDAATRLGEEFDDDMTGVLANLAASKELLAEGIPGIRYLDQGSRSSGEGTRNYVIFPGAEDQIRILRKYAVPGTIGAGAASGMSDER